MHPSSLVVSSRNVRFRYGAEENWNPFMRRHWRGVLTCISVKRRSQHCTKQSLDRICFVYYHLCKCLCSVLCFVVQFLFFCLFFAIFQLSAFKTLHLFIVSSSVIVPVPYKITQFSEVEIWKRTTKNYYRMYKFK